MRRFWIGVEWGLIGMGLLVAVTALWLIFSDSEPPRGESVVRFPMGLVDQNGVLFDAEAVKGKPFAVLFGFTLCPDDCYLRLLELSAALKNIGRQSNDLRILFVTVDPKRDTSALLNDYLANFDPRIVDLTGASADITTLTRGFERFFGRTTSRAGDALGHTTTVFLLDRKGRLFATLNDDNTADARLQAIRLLLRSA